MDLATGRRNRVPVAQLIRRTLKELEPHARELGCERELEGIARDPARGQRDDRQRRVLNANRDIVEVVREIANATEARGRRRLAGGTSRHPPFLLGLLETNHFASWWLDEGWTTVFQARAAQRFPGRKLLPPRHVERAWDGKEPP